MTLKVSECLSGLVESTTAFLLHSRQHHHFNYFFLLNPPPPPPILLLLKKSYDFRGHEDLASCVCIRPSGGNLLACGFTSGAVRLFQLPSTSMLAEHKYVPSSPSSLVSLVPPFPLPSPFPHLHSSNFFLSGV